MAVTWQELPRPLQAVLGSGVSALVDLYGSAAASVALLPPEEDAAEAGLRFVAADGAGDAEVVGTVVPAGRGIVSFVAASGIALVVADVQQDPRFDRALAESTGYVPRTILAAPLVTSGEVLGVVEVLDPSRRTRDLDLLASWASLLAGVLGVVTPATGRLVRTAQRVETEHPEARELGADLLETLVRARARPLR